VKDQRFRIMENQNKRQRQMQLLLIKKHGKKSCFSCRKSIFINRYYAELKLQEISGSSHQNLKIPVRSYLCGKCGFWHLTSISEREYEYLARNKREGRERFAIREANYWEQRLNVA